MTAPKHRWFRYSLRTLFVVVTVFCCWLGYELTWIHRRRSARERLLPHTLLLSPVSTERAKKGGDRLFITWDHVQEIPAWRRFLGDEAIGWIYLKPNASEEDFRLAKDLFPEADVQQMGR